MYVYAAQNSKGHIKIGWTRNFKERFAVLQRTERERLKLIGVEQYESDSDSKQRENVLRRMFWARRVKGYEWFNISREELSATFCPGYYKA
jgi:predicted GIY-YIG superfamily endonuclease